MIHPMPNKLICLSLAAIVFTSCDKKETTPNPDNTSPQKPQAETRAYAPKTLENPAPAPSDSSAPKPGNPPDAATIQSAGTAASNDSPEAVTAEQTIAKYKASGIPGLPQHVTEKILANAAMTESYDDQLNIIAQQTSAWRRINTFREGEHPIPEHMRMMLIERLAKKHGDSWINMIPELDEQIAASAKVDELRAKGIPGLSSDESHEIIIKAMEKYGPDYKAILSVANQSAKK